MNTKIKVIIKHGFTFILWFALFSCNEFLDIEPLSAISPEKYLLEESQLAAYINGLYSSILPSGMIVKIDEHTDNQAGQIYSKKYVPGEWKVPQTDGSNWYFNNIYNCNYFLDNVLPRYESGTISGSNAYIKHYIGEVYFLRAYEYFKRYQVLGDFPIVTQALSDNSEILVDASKRQPRNEVARFILSDLDKAIDMMTGSPDNSGTRISKEVALLLKSRVALYEGTFLKYFNGTSFVPNGPDWPGLTKDYSKDYKYSGSSIDAEINFFLDQSIEAADQLIPTIILTNNTGHVQQAPEEPGNPYMDMFASIDLSFYDEVLLWREYNYSLGIGHSMAEWAQRGNHCIGLTKGLVESFLMANGLPIYAVGSGYHGDNFIADIRKDRDNRLFLFLKEPGQKNILWGIGVATFPEEPYPNIIGELGTDYSRLYNTGYAIRKGNPLDAAHISRGQGGDSYTGIIAFRGVEALLNYIEAWYERHGSLNGNAIQFWQAIRERAKVDPDFQKTITVTELDKEAFNDWGAYSAGQLIDPTLYNIRRERRCELMAEGLRWMDLQRWRSLDQMIVTPYHIEGMKVWGPMMEWYKNADGSSALTYGLSNPGALVSPPDRSEYLRPYEKSQTSLVLDGYRWMMAHYLSPIAIKDMLITSVDNDLHTSPIYQNPGWPSVANESALE